MKLYNQRIILSLLLSVICVVAFAVAKHPRNKEPFIHIVNVHKSQEVINNVGNDKAYYSMQIEYPIVYVKDNAHVKELNDLIHQDVTQAVAHFRESLATPAELKDLHSKIKGAPLSAQTNTFLMSYKLINQSNNIVSIRFRMDTYNYGAAHGRPEYKVINYDLKQGKQLALADLFKSNGNYLTTLENYSRNQLNKKLLDPKYPEQEQMMREQIKEGTNANSTNYLIWNISDKGLLLTFPPYQVAAYVYGPQEVWVPYNVLRDDMAENSVVKRFGKV